MPQQIHAAATTCWHTHTSLTWTHWPIFRSKWVISQAKPASYIDRQMQRPHHVGQTLTRGFWVSVPVTTCAMLQALHSHLQLNKFWQTADKRLHKKKKGGGDCGGGRGRQLWPLHSDSPPLSPHISLDHYFQTWHPCEALQCFWHDIRIRQLTKNPLKLGTIFSILLLRMTSH